MLDRTVEAALAAFSFPGLRQNKKEKHEKQCWDIVLLIKQLNNATACSQYYNSSAMRDGRWGPI